MKRITLLLIVVVAFAVFNNPIKIVKADSLSEAIYEQLGNLELGELEAFYNSIIGENNTENGFYVLINQLIDGNFFTDYDSVASAIKEFVVNDFLTFTPSLVSIVVLAIITSVIHNFRAKRTGDSVKTIVSLTCTTCIIILISKEIFAIYDKVQIAIENMSKLNDIMSPIILTLMVASGGSVSASIYKPSVVFLTTGFTNIVLFLALPLVALSTVFSVISSISNNIKLTNFSDFFSTTFKWIIGLSVTISGLFISIQGLSAGIIDGVSIKAMKYAVTNSVPIIGGFLRDGLDVLTCGSVIIKNVIGVSGLIGIFYILFSPVLHMIVFSLGLKFVSGVVQPFCDNKISSLITSFSKSVTSMIICVLVVSFMFFVSTLLLIISSNSFI